MGPGAAPCQLSKLSDTDGAQYRILAPKTFVLWGHTRDDFMLDGKITLQV